MSEDKNQWLEEAIAAVGRLKSEGGHLHSITNTVAQNFTANVLLACGASVAMTTNAAEMPDFISRSDALHVNLGTLDQARMSAIAEGMEVAKTNSCPVLLDPVMINASDLRRRFAQELLPDATIVRCNEVEAKGLNDLVGETTCRVITGRVDRIDYRGRTLSVENGTTMLGSTIATGCALGALIAILASKTTDPLVASCAGLLWFNIAGERAVESSTGPGSFAVSLIDQLAEVSPDQIRTCARIS